MMIQDSFNLALKNLRKRRLRSWLTMVGIIISVAIIFILISLSIGLQNAVTEQFEILGGDKFFIQPSTVPLLTFSPLDEKSNLLNYLRE